MSRRLVAVFVAAALTPVLLCAQSLADFEKKVTEFTLANGMHFIIVERHGAPVVSFQTYVNAGSVDDPNGQTGIAHMMEHMAFKGTETIGSKNYPLEKAALANIEKVYDQYDQERFKGKKADPQKLKALEADLKGAIEKADSFVVPNEYDRIIEGNGGVGLNAGTGMDTTNYYVSYPANRLELWYLLESERFLRPVFREFYKERDVVREERRMRVESNSQGLLLETLLSTAFGAHPYKNMPGGWASDIENFHMSEAWNFYKSHYTPGNITIGISGDVDPKECKRLAEKYFARIPAGPMPPPVRTVEPPQLGEKRTSFEHKDQPLLLIAYKRPDRNHKDAKVLDVLGDILANGRTSLLYTDMVRDKKIALGAFAQSSFPGDKYPNLFIFFVVPNMGKTVEENEKACYEIIERMKKEKVDAAALARTKTKVRAGLIRKLDSNSGLAGELTSYHVTTGDWRNMFREIEEIDKITADDVMRVAKEYLVPNSRTVIWTYQPKQQEAAK
jgi:predicted Zn-dependent peptidase